MPYIPQDQRLHVINSLEPDGPGELNFLITSLIDGYMRSQGGTHYYNINEVVGVLECAKLELYRRIAAPYEDTKIEQNGDVY